MSTASPTRSPGTAESPPHALDGADVASWTATDVASGLAGADARERLGRDGPNAMRTGEPVRPLAILLTQLTAPMLLLLAGAGVLSAVLGDLAEAGVIFVVVLLNAWIGFRQEFRAERAMAALQAMAAPSVTVVRDGASAELPVAEVVAGDVALLDAGARVPADGRLLEAMALRVDESALTGESAPAQKHPRPVAAATPLAERASMAYAGTSVTAGRGRLVVTATGSDTELGRIAGLLDGADPGQTPLQRRLDVLVRRLASAAGAIVLVVFVLGLLRGEHLDVLLLTGVSLAVAAIPESLPAVVTITLALGAQRMLRRDGLIRRLYAVETLGSVTTICSDKTGTLTQNRMTVTVLDVAGERRTLDTPAAGGADDLRTDASPTIRLLLTGIALCNDTTEDEAGALLGDPTETALVAAAGRHGLRHAALLRAWPRRFELPFDSDRKRMTTVHRRPAAPHGPGADDAAGDPLGTLDLPGPRGTLGAPAAVSFTKGAVDGLLARCTTVAVGPVAHPLDAALRARVRGSADALAADGVRVLGLAVRAWPADGPEVPEDGALERDLTFVGLVGMVDPVRPGVRDAVATCRTAGIRAVMITGDHPLTAAAIGRDLGLPGADAGARTGAELDELDDADLDRVVRETAIYARVSPEHKIRIVEALQRRGEVVAMTGDGVNDAPALKQADIGVAMGITGTDVTKDAADMVLLDDDFSTIIGAVREGRVVLDNIRKYIRNILSGNVAEVSVMVLAPLAGMPIPLLPLQILWLNLVTDGLPAMALAVERPEDGVMDRTPTPLRESLLGADRGVRILTRGALLTVLVLVPAYLLWDAGDAAWQSVLFTSIAMAELAGGFAMRSEQVSLRRLGPFSNRALVGAVALTVALQVVLVTVPVLRDLLGLEPLGAAHWLLVLGVAAAYLAGVELDKAVHGRRRRSAAAAG
ncbi:cation-translocating P-type ATPase [Patulibacter sp.]|uniref:cation-translocating P-type ATPase n=1 Tax=Patulibacter sp. TaxID=1912859 RepID=UPI0027228566|nr:cation-translocating P-type ATPase [Patulibacter sp.]MDO9410889.1 cation-translocating P-type ATPase [Patulibacter sp.]